MISVDVEGHRFHLRAAAVIVHDQHVLLHRLAGDAVWALPGGRVGAGETAASAVVREMQEEVGERVVCDELLYVIENFFVVGGTRQHEVGLYFAATLAPESRLLDKTVSHRGVEGEHVLEFRWFRADALGSVNLHPAVLRDALQRPKGSPRHLIERG
jgi:8-oxo-dGTP pyrophosphatase MutT (NUDIX family)